MMPTNYQQSQAFLTAHAGIAMLPLGRVALRCNLSIRQIDQFVKLRIGGNLVSHLPYLAGIFDGEGCVHFRFDKRAGHWKSMLSISNTDRRPLELAKTIFGGSISGSEKIGSNYIVFSWNVTGKRSERAAHRLLPYSLVKREQLELYLIARATIGTDFQRVSQETKETREVCAERIRLLKSPVVGKRSVLSAQ
jgi:hypothetical protein